MLLIRGVPSKKDKKGHYRSWAVFWCDFCKTEVEKRKCHGLKQKSCGCVSNKLKSESNKGKPKSEEHIQKIKENRKKQTSPMKGRKQTEEWKKEKSNQMKERLKNPENHWNWQNGKSFEEYPQEFYSVRNTILERDKHACQCPDCEHKTDILDVHHIDYDKNNNSLENLVTLCHCCHSKTINKNKINYYIRFYQKIMENKI